MNCNTCNMQLVLNLKVTGDYPCSCDKYCYCENLHFHMEYIHPVNKSCKDSKGIWIVGELSDQYSIERWLKANYKSGDNSTLVKQLRRT